MKLLRGLHNPPIPEAGCVVTIGNFDGVHLGHQAIVERVIAKARPSPDPGPRTGSETQTPQNCVAGEWRHIRDAQLR